MIALILLIALGMIAYFLLSSREAGEARVRVYQDGKMVWDHALNENGETTVQGDWVNRIVIQGGQVSITESSCPGEDCVHSGRISRPGRSIVCLPNRVEVRVEGQEAENDLDAVVR